MAGEFIRFELTGLPWSANERHRRHWRAIHQHDEEWKSDAYFMAIRARAERGRLPGEKVGWRIPKRALVELTFSFPTRTRRDPDNYVAGAKGLLDGLVGVLIEDDDFGHIELRVAGRYRKGEPGVEVRVTAL